MASTRRSLIAWAQAAPLAAVFVVFFLLPLALIVMVSFWQATDYELIPAFTLQSYVDLFSEVHCWRAAGEARQPSATVAACAWPR